MKTKTVIVNGNEIVFPDLPLERDLYTSIHLSNALNYLKDGQIEKAVERIERCTRIYKRIWKKIEFDERPILWREHGLGSRTMGEIEKLLKDRDLELRAWYDFKNISDAYIYAHAHDKFSMKE